MDFKGGGLIFREMGGWMGGESFCEILILLLLAPSRAICSFLLGLLRRARQVFVPC